MRTRVILLLNVPAGHACVYYETRAEACKVVAEWHGRQTERMKAGTLPETETIIFGAGESPTSMSLAILARHIVGMYIPDQDPTAEAMVRLVNAQDEMIRLQKEQMDSGNEWKGQ